jgi:hypothetical protein
MPPDNAVVLSVDEKPSIQALERAQCYLKLPNGRAMTGQSHDYKRNRRACAVDAAEQPNAVGGRLVLLDAGGKTGHIAAHHH